MDVKKTVKYFEKHGFDKEKIKKAKKILKHFKNHFTRIKPTKERLENYFSINFKHDYFPYLVIARLLYLSDQKELYLFLKTYVGQYGVIENIEETMKSLIGESQKEMIFKDLEKPYLGMRYKDINQFTENFINQLEANLPMEDLKSCLAKNNHDIPIEPFLKEKEIYEQSGSLSIYLKDLHNRKIAMLEKHYKDNTIWTEQKVTKEFLEYVKSNQEVLSAKLVDNALYVTKVPYDIDLYFNAKTDNEKAYALCHCPFAREATLDDDINISSNWCYCSGGFAKVLYETIFDQELPIEITHSALKGDQMCRFKIDLKDVEYRP